MILLVIAMAAAMIAEPQFQGYAKYPDEAHDLGQEGLVVASVIVSAEGRVTACTVKESSGSPSLDKATCDIALKRVKYTPAKDDSGSPIESTTTFRINWKLPK